jgi:hypothetical protein
MRVISKVVPAVLAFVACFSLGGLLIASYNCPLLDPSPCDHSNNSWSCRGWCLGYPGRVCTGNNYEYTDVAIHTRQEPGSYLYAIEGNPVCFTEDNCALGAPIPDRACIWDYNDYWCRRSYGSSCEECDSSGLPILHRNVDYTCSNDPPT